MNLQLRADWSSSSNYNIDLDRGTITHSRTANRAQTNRIFNTFDVNGVVKYLTYHQAAIYYKYYRTAEFYLSYLRGQVIHRLNAATLQATPTYIKDHQSYFGSDYWTLHVPISQSTSLGYVRSALDRQKLVDHLTQLVHESIKFGAVKLIEEDENERKEIVVDTLRKIAFAPKAA